jgi:hypothetical protein
MTKDGIVKNVRGASEEARVRSEIRPQTKKEKKSRTEQKEAKNMNYGLNDKNSKNYIADQNRRALLLRILMEQSSNLEITADELLDAINN